MLEEGAQPVGRQWRSRRNVQHALGEELARRHALHRRIDRGQHDAGARGALGQLGQGVDAPAHDLGIGRDPVKGQTIPGREAQRLDAGLEEGERRFEPRHAGIVAADIEKARNRAARHQPAEQEGVMAFRRVGDEEALAHAGAGEESLGRGHDA